MYVFLQENPRIFKRSLLKGSLEYFHNRTTIFDQKIFGKVLKQIKVFCPDALEIIY